MPISPLGPHQRAFAGIPTFMRQPASRELSGVDLAVVGVPFDGGTTSFRTGARFGPRKIRELSLIMWGYNHHHEIAPLDLLSLRDYGDVDVSPVDIAAAHQAIEAEVGHVLRQGPTVIALGGDHSISLPLLRAHAAHHGPLALVQFDSHCDTSDRLYDHGTPFRHAVQEGLVDREAFIQVGIRGPGDHAAERLYARELGARVLTIEETLELGVPGVLKAIQRLMAGRKVYITLDIDAVDPAFAPGTGTPEVGGLTSFQMLQLVRGLDGLDLVGFDLVEVNPSYDHGDITAILAANLAFEFLSLVAVKKRRSAP
jgi:agmatinase/guanidinopropionase